MFSRWSRTARQPSCRCGGGSDMKMNDAYPDDAYPDIDPQHVETEDAVRHFHYAFYEMVVAKYGGDKARQLLKMPQWTKTEIRQQRSAWLLFKWRQSGLNLTRFAKKHSNDPRGFADNMRHWLKDPGVREWLALFEIEVLPS